MSSPLVLAVDTVSATWEGLTPPSRASETYKEDQQKKIGADISAHRKFAFGFPEGPDPELQEGTEKTIAAWNITAEVFISSAGRNHRDAVEAYTNEVVLLRRAIDKIANFPAGVLDIDITDITSDRRGDHDRAAIFNFSIITEETD